MRPSCYNDVFYPLVEVYDRECHRGAPSCCSLALWSSHTLNPPYHPVRCWLHLGLRFTLILVCDGSSCSSCLFSGCGWCAPTQTCHTGDFGGPNDGSVCLTNWFANLPNLPPSASQCPGNECCYLLFHSRSLSLFVSPFLRAVHSHSGMWMVRQVRRGHCYSYRQLHLHRLVSYVHDFSCKDLLIFLQLVKTTRNAILVSHKKDARTAPRRCVATLLVPVAVTVVLSLLHAVRLRDLCGTDQCRQRL